MPLALPNVYFNFSSPRPAPSSIRTTKASPAEIRGETIEIRDLRFSTPTLLEFCGSATMEGNAVAGPSSEVYAPAPGVDAPVRSVKGPEIIPTRIDAEDGIKVVPAAFENCHLDDLIALIGQCFLPAHASPFRGFSLGLSE